MSDYERTAEPYLPLPPDEPFRTWDDVLALEPPDTEEDD